MKSIKTMGVGLLLMLLAAGLAGCDNSFCIAGFCFIDEFEVEERVYDPANGKFRLTGKFRGEPTSHTFKLDKKQVLDDLSFGVWDAEVFRKYTAVKKIHILSASAVETYYKEYVIPGKACPASFMNQNLQSLLLLPADEAIAVELEAYDIPFHGEGTRFQLTGHYLRHDDSWFIKDGKTWKLQITQHESVMSNFGSAQHKLHYFLVTEINSPLMAGRGL